MSSRLQLDMRNLSLGRRHLVNAYEVEAGIGVIAGNTVWSMPECLECEVLQKARYINTLTFYLPLRFLIRFDDPCMMHHWRQQLMWLTLAFIYGVSSNVNPSIATLKPQSNGPSYSNAVIGALAVDGWAATFGTARRGLGGTARPDPSSLYQM